MSLKKRITQQAMKLLSDPRIMKLMQDERFMKAMMAAMSVPGRVSSIVQQQSERLAKVMSIATEQQVRDLRRSVQSLEEQVAVLKQDFKQSPTQKRDVN